MRPVLGYLLGGRALFSGLERRLGRILAEVSGEWPALLKCDLLEGGMSNIVRLVLVAWLILGTACFAEDGPDYDEGIALLNKGDAKGAIAAFEKGLGDNPRNVKLLYAQACARLRLNQMDYAAKLFEQIVALKPKGRYGIAAQENVEVTPAIEAAKKAFIGYARRSLEEATGYVQYRTPDGQIKRLGPEVYIEAQLYDIPHLIFFHRILGLDTEDPLVQGCKTWLIQHMDKEEGRWLWSEEGCAHSRAIRALASVDEMELAQKAAYWLFHSKANRVEDGWNHIESGRIIQSWGGGVRSLSGELATDSTYSFVDTIDKFGSLIQSGAYTIDDPALKGMVRALKKYVEELVIDPVRTDFMGWNDIFGLSIYILNCEDLGISKDIAYDNAIRVLHQRVTKLTENPTGYWEAGAALRGLASGGVYDVYTHNVLRFLLDNQREDGSWPLTGLERYWAGTKAPDDLLLGDVEGTVTLQAMSGLLFYLMNLPPDPSYIEVETRKLWTIVIGAGILIILIGLIWARSKMSTGEDTG